MDINVRQLVSNSGYEHLTLLSDRCHLKIRSLPKGSVSVKKRGRKKYLYLAYRQKNRIIFEYVATGDRNQFGKQSPGNELLVCFQLSLWEIEQITRLLCSKIKGVFARCVQKSKISHTKTQRKGRKIYDHYPYGTENPFLSPNLCRYCR